MAKPVYVLLSFIIRKLETLREFGSEHGWKTSQDTLKNSTIAMNILDFILRLRHDPVFNQIVKKEGILPLSLILRELNRYAAVKGYGVILEKHLGE